MPKEIHPCLSISYDQCYIKILHDAKVDDACYFDDACIRRGTASGR